MMDILSNYWGLATTIACALGPIYSSYDSSISTITITYTRERLYNLRRKSSLLKLSSSLLLDLKSAGILNYRGCRSGRNKLRNINTIVSSRTNTTKFKQIPRQRHLVPIPKSNSSETDCQIKLGCINACSINNKTTIIKSLIDDHSLDILAITETWQDDASSQAIRRVTPAGFTTLSVPRPTPKCAGGVAFIVRKDLKPVRAMQDFDTRTFDFLCINIRISNASFILVVMYRNCSNPITESFFEDFASMLSILNSYQSNIVILGDVNIHLDLCNDVNTCKFNSLLLCHNLKLTFDEPTHFRGHMLDCMIVSNDCSFNNVVVYPPKIISDHSYFEACLSVSGLLISHPEQSNVMRRRWRNLDLEEFKLDLSSSLICQSSSLGEEQDPNDLYSIYTDTLTSLVDKHAPLVLVTNRSRQHFAPWFDFDCVVARRQTRSLEKRLRRFKPSISATLAEIKNALVTSKKALHQLYCKKESTYWTSIIDRDSHDPTKLWKTFQSLMGKDKDHCQAPCPISPEQMAEFFINKVNSVRQSTANAPPAEFEALAPHTFGSFTPVTVAYIEHMLGTTCKSSLLDPLPHWLLRSLSKELAPFVTNLINVCLHTGYVPVELKKAMVTPVLKKPSLEPTEPNNYRPISNLPSIDKILEKVVASQIGSYLTQYDLLPSCQSAYRQYHSTETALVKVVSDIANAIDNGFITALIMLDLSAAFDTVDHNILLKRLELSFGFSGTALQWFNSYLVDRFQTVKTTLGVSAEVPLHHGVPQGSVLGPLLFVLYTSPVLGIITQHGLTGHMYADDSQGYKHCLPPELPMTICSIQDCFAALSMWMIANRLKLNADKTEVIFFGSKFNLSKISVTSVLLNEIAIPVSTVVRNLGVFLDSQLTFNDHCSRLTSNCYMHIRQLWQIRSCLTKSACEKLVHAFISSRLDYCNAILAGCNKSTLHSLQLIQNSAARLVAKTRRRESITPVLKELHWLRYPERTNFKVATFVYKALHGHAPSYFDLTPVHTNPTRLHLRSSDRCDLIVPQIHTTTYGPKSFFYLGPAIWNGLPVELRKAESLAVFQCKLKTFLFNRSYP